MKGDSFDSRRWLPRPRLVAELDMVGPGEIGVVHGLLGTGRRTLVQQWLHLRQFNAVWIDTRIGVEIAGPAPDVVVLASTEGDPPPFADTVFAQWPDVRLVVIAGGGWRSQLCGIEPTVVISGVSLLMSLTEIRHLAQLRGAVLSAIDVERVRSGTGGHATFVDAIIGAAARRKALTGLAVAEGCDRTLAAVSDSATAMGLPWALWERLLLLGRSHNLSRAALHLLWGPLLGHPHALSTILDAGVMDVDERGALVMPTFIRDALRRRFDTELSRSRQERLVIDTAQTFAAEGLLDDAVSVCGGRDFMPVLASLLEQNWLGLGDISANLIRETLDPPASESSPRLTLALARAVIDFAQAGHPGVVNKIDGRYADQLLDRAERHLDEGDRDAALMLNTLRAVRLRQLGDANGSSELLTEYYLGDTSLAVRSICYLHQGVGNLEMVAVERASHLFALAAECARSAGLHRVAGVAEDLRLLTDHLSNDTGDTWQQLGGRPAGDDSPARVINALVHAAFELDLPVLRRLLESTRQVAATDPVVARAFHMQVRVFAYDLLQTPQVAMSELDIFESSVPQGLMTPVLRRLLTITRAAVLADLGRHQESLDVLDGVDSAPVSYHLVRARSLIELGRPREAIDLITNAGDTPGPMRGWVGLLTHVTLAVAHYAMADTEVGDDHLRDALDSAAQTRLRAPFLQLGQGVLAELLARAHDLHLEAPARDLVAYLDEVHAAVVS